MKIGLVSPYDFSYSGGVNNHIAHLAKHFTEWGHEVKILAPCSQDVNGSYACPVISIGRPFPISAIGTVARIPVSPWLPFQVALTLQREKFDILHIHEPLIPLLPLTVLQTSPSVNVGTFHAYHNRPRFYKWASPFLKRCLPRLRGKIVVSEPAREFVARHLPADYRVIPNGIDIHHFNGLGAPRPHYDDGKLNILFVGRLERRKGLDYLLQAYGRVKDQLPPSRLIVVGSGGKNDARYHRMCNHLGIDETVFTGFVSNDDLPGYYASADIFCAPATDGESFGIILLEAMACGVPVIASKVAGYASVLEHEAEGLLVKPKDAADLGQALQKLAGDRSLREQMGTRGRTKAERYNWEHVAREVLEYYQSVI